MIITRRDRELELVIRKRGRNERNYGKMAREIPDKKAMKTLKGENISVNIPKSFPDNSVKILNIVRYNKSCRRQSPFDNKIERTVVNMTINELSLLPPH